MNHTNHSAPGTARDELDAATKIVQTELEAHLAAEESMMFPAIRDRLPRETQALIAGEVRRPRHDRPASGRRASTPPQEDDSCTRPSQPTTV